MQTAIAQQNSTLTHYMFMNMAFNPAVAGSSEGINITGLIRRQWLAFKDDHTNNNTAPQSLFLTIDSPIRFLHGGISGSVVSDVLSAYNNTQVTLGYAYRTTLGSGDFSAGIQVDFLNSKLDESKLEYVTPPTGGDLGSQGKSTDFIVDGSLGLYYKVPDKYYIGLACNQVAQSRLKKLQTRDKREFDLDGGYNWVIPGHPAYELQPSALIQTNLSAFSFSLSALLLYNKKIWGGLAYRYQDAASILIGFSIKSIKIGLSYDATVSKMTRYADGTVEVMLNYCFKIEKEKFRKSYKNTRFL
jgi:type IX secretion system PorP/SprF family membrane protein